MIKELTKEQKDMIPFYVDKWDKIGKEYKKIDEKKVKVLLTKYLGYADIKPKYFIFLNSPLACNLAINILHKTDFLKQLGIEKEVKSTQLDNQLYNQLDNQLYNQLATQLDNQFYTQLDTQLDVQLYTQLYVQLATQLDTQLDVQLYNQLDNQLYTQLYNQLYNQLYVQLDNQLYNQLDNQLYTQLYNQLATQLDTQLDVQLYNQLDNQLSTQLYNQKLDYYKVGWFYQRGNICSGYNCFYDFIIENIIKPDIKTLEIWENFKAISSELHYFFVFKDIVFISQKPLRIEFKSDKLHCENNSSCEYEDGFKLFNWNGVKVPEKLIMFPELITKKDILENSNAEVRRCFMEKLGAFTYYNILSDGKGCTLLDSCIDLQSNVMKLWETNINDDIINKKVQFLECECPSTGRIYNIYPPNQKSKTCYEAKENTFDNTKLTYRHGDVGLQLVGSNNYKTEIET